MDNSKYTKYKKEIGRNMCGESIYETVYIPNFMNCNKCKKEIKNYICIDNIQNGVYKGCGVLCPHCRWFNFI